MLKLLLNLFKVRYQKELADYVDLAISGVLLIVIGIYLEQIGWILSGSALAFIYTAAAIYFQKTKKISPYFHISAILVLMIALFLFGINNLERGWMLYAVITGCMGFLSVSLFAHIRKIKNK